MEPDLSTPDMSTERLAIDGGRPVRRDRLPLTRPWIDEREAAAAAAAVRDELLIGAGAIGTRVEQQLARLLRVDRALLVNSCTSAIEASVVLAGVEPGDEVILPSFTFVSCANAVVRAGGRPVFADIDPATLNLDPDDVAARITPRTRAIMVVHYAGRACDMAAILRLADRHGLRVIEDAAHGLGGSWQGRPLGTIGDFGCFSFHGTKDVVCGEGGALVCRDAADTRTAEIFREKGTNRAAFLRGDVNKYEWVSLGGSLVISDVLAAILGVQLDRLPGITARKRAMAARLTERLQPIASLVRLPGDCPDQSASWHLYPVLVPASIRDHALAALRAEGIGAAFHFVPLHDSPYGRATFGYRAGDLPRTEAVSRSLIRLPLFAAMTDADLDDVAAATVKVIGRLAGPTAVLAPGDGPAAAERGLPVAGTDGP
jgi:dTDP-4-amino-4,6-dideoxygalactose transaminase